MAAVACAMHARKRGDGSCDWDVRCAVRGVNTHDYRWGEAWCREQARQRSKGQFIQHVIEARCTVTGVGTEYTLYSRRQVSGITVCMAYDACRICVCAFANLTRLDSPALASLAPPVPDPSSGSFLPSTPSSLQCVYRGTELRGRLTTICDP